MIPKSGKKLSSTKGFTLSDLLVGIQIMALVSLFAYAGLRLFQHFYVHNMKLLKKEVKTASTLYTVQKLMNESDKVIESEEAVVYYKNENELLRFTDKLYIRSQALDSIKIIQKASFFLLITQKDTFNFRKQISTYRE